MRRTAVRRRWVRRRIEGPLRLPGITGLHVVVSGLEEAADAVLAGADVLRLSTGAGAAAGIAAGRGLRDLGTWFYVADDLDLALELGADGIHLDRRLDLAEEARRAGLRIGATLAGAERVEVDYVEFGRVGESVGGDGALTSWLLGLSRTVAGSGVPVVAGGEIDAANASACIAAGAAGVAVRRGYGGAELSRVLDAALEARAADRAQR